MLIVVVSAWKVTGVDLETEGSPDLEKDKDIKSLKQCRNNEVNSCGHGNLGRWLHVNRF